MSLHPRLKSIIKLKQTTFHISDTNILTLGMDILSLDSLHPLFTQMNLLGLKSTIVWRLFSPDPVDVPAFPGLWGSCPTAVTPADIRVWHSFSFTSSLIGPHISENVNVPSTCTFVACHHNFLMNFFKYSQSLCFPKLVQFASFFLAA